ncbi:MAG: siderophore ABC transporter substrate-binding protein [Bauldia sp.]|nr:siderophore ABC transporter substrate-binding protein [Bauldia sp.]MCW5777726.1 siderophore ABC transporter substrate-binding protein [Phycisphaeraceae bacterium]
MLFRPHPVSRIALGAAILVASGAAALAQTITVPHVQGETVLAPNPETVLTFDLAALDTLTAFGIEADGVPVIAMPDYLARYAEADVAKIGTLFEPDYEAVNALQADLVIVAARSGPVYPQLSAIAPTIDLTVDWTNYLATVIANTETLGTIFEKTAEADAMIATLEERVDVLRAGAGSVGEVFIVMTSGGRVTAYGPGSRFGWVHDDLGIAPAIADVEAATHGEAISFEFLLETNPDWLIVIDRDAATGEAGTAAAELLDNELVRQTTAWQEERVIYVDPVSWYIVNGGYTATLNAANQLIEAFGL